MSAEVLTNLESVGELIGALAAMEETLDQDEYVEGLIREGHEKAKSAFDVAAAATASAPSHRSDCPCAPADTLWHRRFCTSGTAPSSSQDGLIPPASDTAGHQWA